MSGLIHITLPDGRSSSGPYYARSNCYPTIGGIVWTRTCDHSGYLTLACAARLLALPDYMFPGRER